MANKIKDIRQLYVDLLGRQADKVGLDYWAKSNMSIQDIGSAIKEGAEYKTRDIYKTYGIQQDEAGVDYWRKQVDTGALSINQLQPAILTAYKENQQQKQLAEIQAKNQQALTAMQQSLQQYMSESKELQLKAYNTKTYRAGVKDARTGQTVSEKELDNRRESINKAFLGTKQLLIPLENDGATKVTGLTT